MMNDAISKFLAHSTEARAQMSTGQMKNPRNGRSDLDDRIDGDGSRFRLLVVCPACSGQGFTEGYSRTPLVRTACSHCKSTGKFPTTSAIEILRLLEHVNAPQLASPDCEPKAIAAFNRDRAAEHEQHLADE